MSAEALGVLRATPGLLAVNVFRSWATLPVREQRQNRGRWVDAIVAFGGGDPQQAPAWCAYACWGAWHAAAFALGMEVTNATSGGVVQSWLLQANTPSQIHIDDVRRGNIVLQPGDLFIRTRSKHDTEKAWRGSRSPGHAEMVIGAGEAGWLHTVGGNTDGGDSREGSGVFEKRRGIRLDDPRLVGFVRPHVDVLLKTSRF